MNSLGVHFSVAKVDSKTSQSTIEEPGSPHRKKLNIIGMSSIEDEIEEQNYEDGSDYSIESEHDEVQREDEEDLKENVRLIRITRPPRIKWDLFTMVLAFWNALSIPFFVAFRPKEENSEYMFAINTIIDLLF